jgi:hypothetical protein
MASGLAMESFIVTTIRPRASPPKAVLQRLHLGPSSLTSMAGSTSGSGSL